MYLSWINYFIRVFVYCLNLFVWFITTGTGVVVLPTKFLKMYNQHCLLWNLKVDMQSGTLLVV